MAGKFDKLNDEDFEKEVKQIIKVSKDYEEAKIVLDVIRTNTNFEDLDNQIKQDEKRKKLFLWLLIGFASIIVIVLLYLALNNKEKSKLDELTARVDSLTKLANNKANSNATEKIANINIIKLKDYDAKQDATSLNKFIEYLSSQGYTKVNLRRIENNKKISSPLLLNIYDLKTKIEFIEFSELSHYHFVVNSIKDNNDKNQVFHLILGRPKLNNTKFNYEDKIELDALFSKQHKKDSLIFLNLRKNDYIYKILNSRTF